MGRFGMSVAAIAAVAVALSGCSAIGRPDPAGPDTVGTSGTVSAPAAGSASAGAPRQKPSDTADLPEFARHLVEQVDSTPWPIRPIDPAAPLSAVTVDTDHSVTETIGPDGGDISVTAGDVSYTLHLPADALVFDTAITMAPIVTIAGLDLPHGTLRGVDLQPHGLQLTAMAELRITGVEGDVLGFAYSDAGFDLRPAPIAPDPDRLAVYVSHFSGAGVGPFAALGEALAEMPSNDGPAAELAHAAARAHNKTPGTSLDQLAELYVQMLDQLNQLAAQAARDCERGINPAFDAYVWVESEVWTQFAVDRTEPPVKAVIRGIVDGLVSCWDLSDDGGCFTLSAQMIRQLQGIKALLIRWKALDEAAARTGKRAIGDWAYCSAQTWIDYTYESSDGHHQIGATLKLKFDASDGRLDVITERSSYTIGERSVGYQPECPSTMVGYGSFGFDELPPGSEISPTVQADWFDDEMVTITVGPVYHFVATDCHGTTDGWEGGLALACSPDDGSSDALIGTVVEGSDGMIVSFDCDNPSMDAKTTGMLILGNAIDKIIPPELWD